MSTRLRCDWCGVLGVPDPQNGKVIGWFRLTDYDPEVDTDEDGWGDWPDRDFCSYACLEAWAEGEGEGPPDDDDEDDKDEDEEEETRPAKRRGR